MFKTQKVKTQTLGEYLSDCRRRVNLSLVQAAQLAQVQPKYLEALEAGRFADLPAPVYVRGFLKSLAKVFHANPQKLLTQFDREQEIARNLRLAHESQPETITVFPRFVLSSRTLTFFGVVVLGIASLGYLYFQVSSLSRPPALEIIAPAADEVTNSSVLLIAGQTEPGASVYFNSQPIVVDADGEFHENLSLAPGTNQLTIRVVNKFNQEKVVTRSIIYEPKEIAGSVSNEPQSREAQLSVEELVMEIRMNDEAAWIALEVDGAEVFSGTMLPNARRTVMATDKIILTTGNAGTTRIFLNGEDLGVLGNPGEVIRDIEFTK